jgi:hypothetical protein
VAKIALNGVRFRQNTTAHTAIRAGGGGTSGSGSAVFHDQSSALPIKKPAIRVLFPEPGRASLPKLSVLWKAITGPAIAKTALARPALWQRPGYGLVQQIHRLRQAGIHFCLEVSHWCEIAQVAPKTDRARLAFSSLNTEGNIKPLKTMNIKKWHGLC